jgi:hypothetical protein
MEPRRSVPPGHLDHVADPTFPINAGTFADERLALPEIGRKTRAAMLASILREPAFIFAEALTDVAH